MASGNRATTMTKKPVWISVVPEGSTVVAAVSGGADSLYLALYLKEVASREEWDVHVVCCEHHLRGDEAAADARFVEEFALREGLRFAHLHVYKSEFGPGESVEAELREERYAVLREYATSVRAAAIAVGHSMTDAAETFLLMALRGSGPRGLGSMRECADIPGTRLKLIRPLMHLTREEIRASLKERGVHWLEDSMNADSKYRRVRVRDEVLPLLQSMEPGAVKVLARSARLCAEENEELRLWTLTMNMPMVCSMETWALFDLERIPEAGPTTLRVHLTSFLEERGEPSGMPWSTIEDLAERIANRDAAETLISLNEAWSVFISGRWMLLHKPARDYAELLAVAMARIERCFCAPGSAGKIAVLRSELGDEEVVAARIPGTGDLIGVRADARTWLTHPELKEALASRQQALLAPSRLKGDHLVVRVMEKDELIITSGGRKAVRDVLQEAGVPACLRHRVVGVCDAERILWVPGVRRADVALVEPGDSLATLLRWNSPQ